MKSKAAIVIATLCVAVAGYVAAGPFLTIHQIKTALFERDAEKLSDNIDFPTFRQNLKDQLSSLLMKQTASEMKDNPFGGLAMLFASKLVDSMVDSFVTPAGLASLMQGQKPEPEASTRRLQSSPAQPAEIKQEPFKGARYGFDSASKFSAWVKAGDGEEMRFVFTRDGLKWKLSNIVIPNIHAGAPGAARSSLNRSHCLRIGTFDSSVLSSNVVYTELAWKVDVVNSCSETLSTRVTFTIYDKDEFELDSDHQEVIVPANGTGKARGEILVSPPDKARRMAKQGATLSLY